MVLSRLISGSITLTRITPASALVITSALAGVILVSVMLPLMSLLSTIG